MDFVKYPRTQHTPDSKGQAVSLLDLQKFYHAFCDSHFVIEEKMDGIGFGLGFNNGIFYVQHRGHIYTSLPPMFNALQHWIIEHEEELYVILGEDKLFFGEFMKFKHSVFYDNLPDIVLEYDIYDKTSNQFLTTVQRQSLLHGSSIVSVPVLQGHILHLPQLYKEHAKSTYQSKDWENNLEILAQQANDSDIMEHTALYEGFYIKVENTCVSERLKWISNSFMAALGTHWKELPKIHNQCSHEIYSQNNRTNKISI